MARRHRTWTTGNDGFSLTELLVGLMVASVTLGTGALMADQFSRVYTTQLDSATANEEARFALQWIDTLVRSAGSNPFDIVTASCPVASTPFMAIQRDPDDDGVQDDIRVHADVNPPNGLLGGVACGDDPDEDVTIAHDAVSGVITYLDNNGGGAPLPMTEQVITGLLFEYLDASRAPTTIDADVAFVRITVTAAGPTRDHYLGQAQSYVLSGEVRIRGR